MSSLSIIGSFPWCRLLGMLSTNIPMNIIKEHTLDFALRQDSSKSHLSLGQVFLYHCKTYFRENLLLIGSHIQRTQRSFTSFLTPRPIQCTWLTLVSSINLVWGLACHEFGFLLYASLFSYEVFNLCCLLPNFLVVAHNRVCYQYNSSKHSSKNWEWG